VRRRARAWSRIWSAFLTLEGVAALALLGWASAGVCCARLRVGRGVFLPFFAVVAVRWTVSAWFRLRRVWGPWIILLLRIVFSGRAGRGRHSSIGAGKRIRCAKARPSLQGDDSVRGRPGGADLDTMNTGRSDWATLGVVASGHQMWERGDLVALTFEDPFVRYWFDNPQ
jgi:hypothetical protein